MSGILADDRLSHPDGWSHIHENGRRFVHPPLSECSEGRREVGVPAYTPHGTDVCGTGFCGLHPTVGPSSVHVGPGLVIAPPRIQNADPVEHPAHYLAHPSGVECITIVQHMGFNLGNVIKYVWRADLKGNQVEDLKKARRYLDYEIERLEKMDG